jgi:hypothetical protein
VSRGGQRRGAGRPKKRGKIDAEEARKFLSHVDNVCRLHGLTLLEACAWIANPAHAWPDLMRDPVTGKAAPGESNFDGEIDGSGYIRGVWVDDLTWPVSPLNYPTPRGLKTLYYELLRANTVKRKRRRSG